MQTETTPNLYISRDQLVSIRVLDAPKRWPRHDYKCVVIRVTPRDHERIRRLNDGRIEIMLTKEELRALVEGFQKCDPEFGVTFTCPMLNKPEGRKQQWRRTIRQRISQGRFYRIYRSRRRH